MASLAMASGSVLYSSACESTGYRVQDVSEILHQPSSTSSLPETEVKFLQMKSSILFFNFSAIFLSKLSKLDVSTIMSYNR